MIDLTETTVTEAVLDQMATTADPRLKEIMDAAVKHLHAFAKEVRLTPEEWLTGIRVLTQIGQACTPARQEFILLSDTLGLSALVNIMHDGAVAEHGTESSLLGPFFREDAPNLALGDSIAQTATGPELVMYGQVRDSKGRAVPGATIRIWQTDSEGAYDLQTYGTERTETRGNFTADAEGRYFFRTIRPKAYSIPMDGPVGAMIHAQGRHGCRPAHIHVLIAAPGYRELVTALYLADDAYVDSDTVFGVSSSLVIRPVADDGRAPIQGMPSIAYDFVLSPETGVGTGRVGSDPSKLVAVG